MSTASPAGTTGAALVLGGGVAGIQCSLDLAEGGYKVYLVEKQPALGGHMAQLAHQQKFLDRMLCARRLMKVPWLVQIAYSPHQQKRRTWSV